MATTLSRTAPASTPLARPAGRAGLRGALRSEFTKLRSVRSTYWTLIALVIVIVGIGAAAGASAAKQPSQLGPNFDPTNLSLYGLFFGQLIIAVLGALTVTAEYSTQMIGTSLVSMPRRGTLITAKVVVFGGVALAAGLVACFGAFFVGQALMSSQHLGASIGQPHVLRAVIGGALFLTVCGLLGLGLGLILRHTAAAIGVAVGLLFVLFLVALKLPASWPIVKWVPLNAGGQVWQAVASPASEHMFSAWTGFGVFCGYAAIAIAGGLILFRRRDA